LKKKTTRLNTFIYSTKTKIVKNLPVIIKEIEKNSPQDGYQMVEMKFNYYIIVPEYNNNNFTLQYAHIHNLCLDSKHI